jgi:uncharacterized protein YjaG (DUF416 family)
MNEKLTLKLGLYEQVQKYIVGNSKLNFNMPVKKLNGMLSNAEQFTNVYDGVTPSVDVIPSLEVLVKRQPTMFLA